MKKLVLLVLTLFSLFILGCGGGGSSGSKVENIEILKLPTKLIYSIGESIDLTGLEVKAYYDDGTEKTLDNSSLKISGFSSTTAGDKTIVITFDNKTATFTVNIKAATQTANVLGTVKDVNNVPLEGITVDFNGNKVVTNSQGFYQFNNISKDISKIVLKFSNQDYFDVVRSEENLENKTNYTINVKMIKRQYSETSNHLIIDAENGGEINIDNGSKVELAPKSIVDANGNNYTGNVHTSLAYLDPTSDNFAELIPGGSMEAIREDGSDTMLISYGIIKVELRDDNGNLLQLKNDENSKALIEVAVPDSIKNSAPETIPLWYFDEEKGIWVEEGFASLNEEKTKYIGYVAHFTDWNCDVPADDQAVIFGYVKDNSGNPVSDVFIKLGQIYAITDANGYYIRRVPANIDIETSIPDFFGVKIEGPTVNLAPGEEKEVSFTLPNTQTIEGSLLNSQGQPESGFVTIRWGEYYVSVYALNGAFKASLPSDVTNIEYVAFGSDNTNISGNANLTTLPNGKLIITLGSETIITGKNEIFVNGVKIDGFDNFSFGFIDNFDNSLYIMCANSQNMSQNTDSWFAISVEGINATQIGKYDISADTEAGGFAFYWAEQQRYLYSNTPFTLELTRVDAVGGLIEGKFYGATIEYDAGATNIKEGNVSGSFSVKRYSENMPIDFEF